MITSKLTPGLVIGRARSDVPTEVRPRFPIPGRVRTLKSILRLDPDQVRSLAFQLSVRPVYFKDLPGKSRVGLCMWSDYLIEMGSALIKLKLGRFPISMFVSRLIGGCTTSRRPYHQGVDVPPVGGCPANGRMRR